MSIVVTCNLSDGVIVGTDSAITIHGKAVTPQGLQTGVLKTYSNSEKLFQLENLPIAVATYGLGTMGERSIGSYIKEFEFQLNSVSKRKKTNLSIEAFEKKSVRDIAVELRKFFLSKYKEVLAPLLKEEMGIEFEDIPADKKPLVGLVVAGFSHNQYLSEIWQIRLPLEKEDEGLVCIRETGRFGTNWFGQTDSVIRLIKGYDNFLPNKIIDYFVKTYKIEFSDNDKKEISNILAQFEYRIPYQAMPIQEGIDHVKFLLDLVINQNRFVVGAPLCSGPVKIGVVRRGEKNFKIITNDELVVS